MGYTAKQLIEIAKAEIGYLEKKSNSNLDSKTGNAGDNNWTKYARDLHKAGYYNGNKNGYAWCDVFVDHCHWIASGKDAKEAQRVICQTGSYGAGCTYSAKYYQNQGRLYKTPMIGDQIFFWNATKTKIAHTGIVSAIDNTYVYTIEGNTSGASGVIANGGGVCAKKYKLTYGRIYGYGRPFYDEEKQVVNTQPKNTKIDTVKEVQEWLNKTYSFGLKVDDNYGKKTKTALIKALQIELGFVGKNIDGKYGTKTNKAVANNNLKNGSKGDLVKVLQALLVCNGYTSAYVDGSFGAGTENAVKAYQKKKKLKSDGIAGSATFKALCK